MQRNRKYRLNNSGMSLVEVIIAMTILSVVVIAVMQSLTMAMVYNKKARAKQDTTIKAESVMELFKGYNMDELYKMFAAGGGAVKDMVGDATYSVSGTEPKTGTPSDLTFKIDGLTISSTDGGTGETYDVQIVAKPVPEVALFETQKFDSAKDAVFISDESYDEDARDMAYADILSKKADFVTYLNGMKTDGAGNSLVCDSSGNDFTEDNISTYLDKNDIFLSERRTVFTIADDGVKVKMIYQYRIYGFEYYEKIFPEETSDTYGTDEYGEPSSEAAPTEAFAGELKYLEYPAASDADLEFEVPMDGASIEKVISSTIPERLFIYYYPQYEEHSRVNADGTILAPESIDDKIAIDDTRSDTSKAIDCFIIKQRRSAMSNASIHVKESAYKLAALSKTGNVVVYDNFSEDISDGDPLVGKDVTGSTYYMDAADKVDNVLAYALELTVTKTGTGNVVTRLVSSTNER